MVVLFESLDESVCIVRGIVVNNIGGIVSIDFVDVFAEFAAWFGLDLLAFLEATALNESALGLEVGWEYLCELSANVCEDIVGSELKEGLKSRQVGAHLDDVLKSLLGLVLKILGALGKHVDSEESGGNVSLSEEFGVIWGVSANLTERPGSSSLEVIFRLVDQGILKRSNTLGNNDCHGERIVESRDVAESHNTWKTSITLGLRDVVNNGSCTTGVNDKLGELCGLLSDFSDASGSILSDLNIKILQAVEDSGEDFSLNNDFSKINSVLSDLSKA